ncbi:Crp/Fnr family transcriptional regulator [Phenylobacterium sp.]|uniref:Crp/Fnr family transcriptional regulator n=1 Tax=Phenylobacterium sp. TaxID=1871053 RepID=UPI0035AE30EF
MERLRTLCDRTETWTAGAQVEAPQRGDRYRLITTGWIYEARLLPDGRRQIFGYLLPGDLICSRHASRAPPSVLLALTRSQTVDIPAGLATTPEGRRTTLGEGLADAVEQQEQRSYAALLRLGKYTAIERVAHLVVELRDRLARVGLARDEAFQAPLTQEHLADTLGLSVIHVNRVLRELRNHRLLTIKFGVVTMLQPERLERLAEGRGGRVLHDREEP